MINEMPNIFGQGSLSLSLSLSTHTHTHTHTHTCQYMHVSPSCFKRAKIWLIFNKCTNFVNTFDLHFQFIQHVLISKIKSSFHVQISDW